MIYNKDVDYAAIGKRVKELRAKKKMSQEQLAESADISTTYLSNIENAHSKASLPTFLKIANALNCGVDALLCDSIKESRHFFEEQLGTLLEDCSKEELKIIVGTLRGLKEQIRTVEILNKKISE
jgi:transcriptional regulator with XRE-family HTH domain